MKTQIESIPMDKANAIAYFMVIAMLLSFRVDRADAVPAWPGVHHIKQPDGGTVEMRLRGDEFYHWHETKDGFPVVKDKSDGFWKYAVPDQDSTVLKAIPEAVVGKSYPEALGLSPQKRPVSSKMHDKIIAKRNARNERQDKSITKLAPPARIPISGTTAIRNVVILAAFSDHWDASNARVLASKGRLQNEYDALFNEEDYTTGQAVGSVRDYYNEVSYGDLEVESIVTPWIKLPNTESYYGENDLDGWDNSPQEMAYDAVEAAAAAGFDFSQGDSDGDGWVDCLTIIHSGHGEEGTWETSYLIWSHQWNMTSVRTKNGVNMYRYHTSPALRGDITNTNIIRIGVICHEMGHFFGLPDLYDYSGKTLGIGPWGLMAFGSWNGDQGASPAHFCAWSKFMLGIVQPLRMHSNTGVELPSISTSPVAHMYRDGLDEGEYFLVENRTKSGFDNTMNIEPGIVIYHIYDRSNNNDLDTWEHPVVRIEEANGNDFYGLQQYTEGEGEVVWKSGNGLTGGFSDQTGSLYTNAMAYQTHFYNRPDNSASYSYISLNNFSDAGATMTYDATTLRPTVISQAVTQPSYTVNWTASANASNYELQEGRPVTLNAFTDGAEDEDFMFDYWTFGGSVQRSNLGRRTGEYSYVLQVADMQRLYSAVQSMTLRTPFILADNTNIIFHYQSKLNPGSGYLKLQISNDGGSSWKTLETYGGYTVTWQKSTITGAAINAAGMNIGDACIVRFIANFEDPDGYTSFPAFGYAVDDIEINAMAMDIYGDFVSLDDTITDTFYAVTDKADGEYAYRVRAYANDAWQGYGAMGIATVAVAERTVTFQTDGTPGAELSGELSQTVYAGEDCTPVEVSIPDKYTFTGWVYDDALYSDVNPITVTKVHDDMVLVATFEIKTYTLNYSAEAHGVLQGEQIQTVAHGEDGTPVEAVPDDGYRFVTWSDASTDNPRIDTNITSSSSVTASFERVYYTLELTKTGVGEVQLNSGKVPLPWTGDVPENDIIYLEAFPGSGYVFTGWSGEIEIALNPYDFSMDKAYSVIAIFTKEGGEEGESEGEGEKEGESVTEGEAEEEAQREGELEGESEGESTLEGEKEGEESANTGCCKSGDTPKALRDMLSDWLLLGVTTIVLLAMTDKKR